MVFVAKDGKRKREGAESVSFARNFRISCSTTWFPINLTLINGVSLSYGQSDSFDRE